MNTDLKRVLVVDDEEDLRELLKYNLTKDGFEVLLADSGASCLQLLESESVDLIVLDLMMPEINGLETCRIIRNNDETAQIPIIMLTARGEESDIVVGLEFGADDYMTKPFSCRVLSARIRSVLRRSKQEKKEVDILQHGDIKINVLKREVSVADELIKTTYSEFEIILFLAKNPGWVKSRSQIIKQVHGDDYPVTDRAIDVQIVGLRKKLGEAGKVIETIRGIGYRFKEEEK